MAGTLSVELVLAQLRSWAADNGRRPPRATSGGNWSACCPAHDDHNPSLSVGPGDKHPVVLHCHAGCEPEDVFAALGLNWRKTRRRRRRSGVAANSTLDNGRIVAKPTGGHTIHYDIRGWDQDQPRLKPKPTRRAVDDGQPMGMEDVEVAVERGSFADRVTSRSVNLVEVIERGLPPLDFLPASEEMLIRGKRHMIAAPYKEGKSIAALVHLVDMALAGARVTILDRENGAALYATRLRDIMDARRLSKDQRTRLWDRLSYYEFPWLTLEDEKDLVIEFGGQDLVVFDSQRMFLSDLGLKEDLSDDYVSFMHAVIDPLFRAGIATLLLDNTGHTDKKRSRGTSSKGDLNEVLFSLKTLEEFDVFRRGQVRLKVERSRFGNVGEWTMSLGGGEYNGFKGGGPVQERDDFKAACVAELESADGPMGADRLIGAVRKGGVNIGTAEARHLLRLYVASPGCPITHTGQGYEAW